MLLRPPLPPRPERSQPPAAAVAPSGSAAEQAGHQMQAPERRKCNIGECHTVCSVAGQAGHQMQDLKGGVMLRCVCSTRTVPTSSATHGLPAHGCPLAHPSSYPKPHTPHFHTSAAHLQEGVCVGDGAQHCTRVCRAAAGDVMHCKPQHLHGHKIRARVVNLEYAIARERRRRKARGWWHMNRWRCWQEHAIC